MKTEAAPAEWGTLTNLTIEDGLSGETVNSIMTDSHNYTWIATTGGISVYNGRDLMTLRLTDDRGRYLQVKDICETGSHTIYAATEAGLYRMNWQLGRFERVLPEVERPTTLFAVGDTVYIGGEQGVQMYDSQRLVQRDVGAGRKGLDNVVRHYALDDVGNIWFLGRHDLYRFYPKTNRIETFPLVEGMGGKQTLSQMAITHELFVIGTRSNGLYVYNSATRQVSHIDTVGKIVTSVSRCADGQIAVATDGDGAYLLEVENGTLAVKEHFSMQSEGFHHLPTNSLYSFYRDTKGTNWLGTVRCGLLYNPHSSCLFRPYTVEGISTRGMNVRSFLMHGSQSVIGLQDGLLAIDTQRHQVRQFDAQDLGGHIVNSLQWWQDYYVVGLYDGGIRLLRDADFSLSRQSWSPLLDMRSVGDIKVSPKDSSLWIGCSDGLFIIRRDGTLRQLTEQNSRITGGIIMNITFDADGNAWLCGAKGLSLYSAASQDVVDTDFPEGFFHQEPYMRGILGCDGTVYMRTGPQLFYTTPKMDRFGEKTLPVTLVDRWCRSMADSPEWLWMASERGLLGLRHQGEGMVQLRWGEGLESQISDLAIGADSTLWVATSEGLFHATWPDFNRWRKQNNYRITLYNVRIGSDLIDAAGMARLAEEKDVTLTWHFTSQVLQAEPVLLDYAVQRGRLYEYKVDGGNWCLVENGQPIDVRQLMLGAHELTIRLAGVSSTETTWRITVVPSLRAIAELLLLIIGIVLLWLWWRWRKNTNVLLHERDEILDTLVKVEEENLQEEALPNSPSQSPSLVESGEASLSYAEPTASIGGKDIPPISSQKEPAAELPEESLQSPKYQKVKVDEDECAGIVSRMKDYIERERVYTNQNLKMKDLADVLHLSAPKLSQVFNLYLKTTYYDFINQYRLQEFKRLIAANEYKRYTITALSEQCGFKRANFFSTFRKTEGMTPAEYLKKQGISV